MKIGIIGLGNFGRFAAETLAKDENLEVVACDPGEVDAPANVRKVTLEEVAGSDVVILCVPLSAYGEVLPKLRPLLSSDALVVDICSVKVEAEKRLRAQLPEHQNLLVTHPMFGPQSAANGMAGHTLVVTGVFGQKAEEAVVYANDVLGLTVMRMTNEEHDKTMAEVHALTFFVARGLRQTGLQARPFQAPSFQMLLNLVAFNNSNTEDLFRTIELGNPYAKSAREKFVKTLQAINEHLDKEEL